jgi:hypothetical protein
MSDEPWGRIVLRAAGDRNLKGEDLRVLISIASRFYGDPDQSLNIIANDCGIDSSKVCRSIKRLEGAYIEKIPGDRGRPNTYRLILLPREAVPPGAVRYCRGGQVNIAVKGSGSTAAGGSPYIDSHRKERAPQTARTRARGRRDRDSSAKSGRSPDSLAAVECIRQMRAAINGTGNGG